LDLEPRTLVIGTRGSRLALWQAEHVAALLCAASAGVEVRLERIRTTGDRIADVPLAQVGGKALFVKEIEEALLAGRVDLAVHSLKDLPTDLPAGLLLAAVPLRDDPSDVLIARDGRGLHALPRGARVGTSSLRRQAQLLHHRPDLVVVNLRGNLDTRIRKLTSEGLDAIVVAAAGVRRLHLTHLVTEVLPPEILLPAIGQGALGIEICEPRATSHEPRAGSHEPSGDGRGETASHEPRAISHDSSVGRGPWSVAELVAPLDHRETHAAVRAERALLRRLGGGCQVPIAAQAVVEAGDVRLRGLVASLDGATVVRGEARGDAAGPEAVGVALAEDLLARGGRTILDALQPERCS
jgi:hydroxymethylbilane synthase